MDELAEFAEIDRLIGGKQKEKVEIQNAISNNEKIRDWVSLFKR
jgi:hypothetical protein